MAYRIAHGGQHSCIYTIHIPYEKHIRLFHLQASTHTHTYEHVMHVMCFIA